MRSCFRYCLLLLATVSMLCLVYPTFVSSQTDLINANLIVVGHVNACTTGPTGTTGNAYACTFARPVTLLTPKACYSFVADVANTGAATVNYGGIGAKAITKTQGGITTPLAANDIRAGMLVQTCYDGVNMQCQNCLGNAPTGGGGAPSGIVASGTVTLPATTVAAGTCTAPQLSPAPGAQGTDVVVTSFQGDPTTVAGYAPSTAGTLILRPYVESANLAVKRCNYTPAPIVTAALTLNWKIFAGGVLPSGVTLRPIDGGPTYYCDAGLTRACAAGWDSPSFFPVALWLSPMHGQPDANRWHDVGVNTAIGITADSNLTLLAPNALWLVAQANELPQLLASLGGALGPETVGILAYDEPQTYAQAIGAIQTIANTHQDGRWWHEHYTWNQIAFSDVETHPMTSLLSDLIVTPNTTTRHLDIVGADIYWFAGNGNTGAFNGQILYNLDHAMTRDEMRRASHYGDMLDRERLWQVGHFPAPLWQIIENGGPYTENTTQDSFIQPPEFHAAVWSSIMHGARGILIFNASLSPTGPAFSFDNLAQSYYQTPQGGQTISIYHQTKATFAQVHALAPVINAPFALNYVSVTPAATDFAGFDAVAKYAAQQFYVLAMPRYSQTVTNQVATFTVKSGTTAVVIDEARSIPISGGQFSDTFATANTVHIYRIE